MKNDPELAGVLKLHNFVQRVKKKNNEIKNMTVEMKAFFQELDDNLGQVFKEQKSDMIPRESKKDKDKKDHLKK